MKAASLICLVSLSLGILSAADCKAQNPGKDSLLSLEKTIKLPGVQGRIDHLSFDAEHNIAYVTALGNNTVEAADITSGIIIHTVTGLNEPQGVQYIPFNRSILVSNGGNGICSFFKAVTLQPAGEINLHDDADNIRYVPEDNIIYVGYGNGAIAVIDAATQKLIGNIKLDGHPESFQVDTHKKRIWVNIPKLNMVEVADGAGLIVIAKWKIEELEDNYPLAYDSLHHRLFIGCRSTSSLLILNSETGEKIALLNCVGDADDFFYDEVSGLIIISGGEGYIDLFKQQDADKYNFVTHVSTRKGARTSLWLSGLNKLLVAVPENKKQPAELRVYKLSL